jgi:RNA polymerase sigma factor (sigma-70 family)
MGRPVYPPTSLTLLGKLADPENTREWNESWRRFTELYGPPILARCHRRGLQEGDAEEVLAVVLLKLLELMKTYEFRRWLRALLPAAVADVLEGLRGEPPAGTGAEVLRALEERVGADGLEERLRKDLARGFQQEDHRRHFSLKALTTDGANDRDKAIAGFLDLARLAIARCCDTWGLPGEHREWLGRRIVEDLGRTTSDRSRVPLPRFHSWLNAVVRNSAIDCVRDLRQVAQRDRDTKLLRFLPDVPGDEDDFVRALELRDLFQEAEARVEGVSERDWQIYHLIAYKAYTGQEVAEIVGVPVANVYVYFGRVRSKVAAQVRMLESEAATGAEDGP